MRGRGKSIGVRDECKRGWWLGEGLGEWMCMFVTDFVNDVCVWLRVLLRIEGVGEGLGERLAGFVKDFVKG